MEPDFWLDRWQQSQIGFHQSKPEPLLVELWPSLKLDADASVFVPLCGKSLDMVWLADQGHSIVGIELSPIAIEEFFQALDLVPEIRSEPGFTVSTAGPYQLWCGDFFALPEAATAGIAAIYDRASLIALPPDMRTRYAGHLTEHASAGTQALLVTLEYDQSILAGPPHSVDAAEVGSLFAVQWQIDELSRQQTSTLSPKFKEHGLDTVGQTAYRLTRSTDEQGA